MSAEGVRSIWCARERRLACSAVVFGVALGDSAIQCTVVRTDPHTLFLVDTDSVLYR